MSGVGREIRRLREERGWSQSQLAVYAGSSQPTVNLVETGRRNPSAGTLEKLAAALGVEVADFFPKAEAPLPFEEVAQEQRRSPVVEAWTSYMLRRAEEWDKTLPEEWEERLERGELFAKSQLAREFLRRNELVQVEAAMLLKAVSVAIAKPILRIIDADVGVGKKKGKPPRGTKVRDGWLWMALGDRYKEQADLVAFSDALNRMNSIAERWFSLSLRAEDAIQSAAGNETEDRGELTHSKERTEKAFEERRNVVALLEERLSA